MVAGERALVLVLMLGLPYEGRLLGVLAGVAVPWSLFNLWLARRAPERAMNPLIAAGDLAVLAAIEAVAPEHLRPRAVHGAVLPGRSRPLPGRAAGTDGRRFAVPVLGIPTAFIDDRPVEGTCWSFYEGAFAAAALGTVVAGGPLPHGGVGLAAAAREISRRTLRAEHEIRRRLSQSLHDGPVQELISAGHGARGRQERGRRRATPQRAAELIEDARARPSAT